MARCHSHTRLPHGQYLDDALQDWLPLMQSLNITIFGGCEGGYDLPDYYGGRLPGMLAFTNVTPQALSDLFTAAGIPNSVQKVRSNGKTIQYPVRIWEQKHGGVLIMHCPANPYNDAVVVNFYPEDEPHIYQKLLDFVNASSA